MPYYGRGGAGNINAAAQERARTVADPEAQLSTAEQPVSTTTSSTQDDPAYKRSGRGGAGNFFSTSDDAKLPVSQAEIDAASKPTSAADAPPKYGRGGAGNLTFAAGEKAGQDESAKSEEQKMQQRVTRAVEKSVEEVLQIPERARLPT